MGDAIHASDLGGLLADLAAKADAGDEDAAMRLNELAGQCTPAVLRKASDRAASFATTVAPVLPVIQTSPLPGPVEDERSLGAILAEALGQEPEPSPWDTISAASDLIAAHYCLDPGVVWSTIADLEDAWAESDERLVGFGRLLERPLGFTLLGLLVAQHLLGVDEAGRIPPLSLGYH